MNADAPGVPVRDSYVIRVYRRGEEPGREVSGLVDVVARGETVAFNGRDELWAVLVDARRPRRGRPRGE